MNTKQRIPCATAALLALALGCSSSNDPATTTGTGGTTATSTGGTTTASTGGSTGSGGTTATTGTGGTTATSTGGVSASGGHSGAAGSSGSSDFGQPACTTTSAGVAVKKGGSCTAADPQLCYNTCGPEKSGVKPETCSAGAYAEGPCQFDPAKDFSCYKVPAAGAFSASCPAGVITSGAACTVPDCTVCGAMGYTDSSGSPKTGYCVCQSGSANPTWSCASTTAWPCPAGSGC
jgi:hypothetical protein